MNTIRVILITMLVAVAPISIVTLQTLRAAWSQEKPSEELSATPAGDELKIAEIKAQLAGGPDAIRARKELAASLPVSEMFHSGFRAQPLNTPAGSSDKAWEELSISLTKINHSRTAFGIAENHIGRRSLSALSNEQLSSFAEELQPHVAEVPTLKEWPKKLEEMSKEAAATKVVRNKLNSIGIDLDNRISAGGAAISRIPDADLRKWSQQLSDMKNPKGESVAIDNFPVILEQHRELKRRIDFWESWNPPAYDNSKRTAGTLESRREALLKLEKTARSSLRGEAKLPEEVEHIDKVSKEIEHLAGEVMYLRLNEDIASKKSATKSMADLLKRMEPIIETGAHRDDLIKDFKSSVELRLATKKVREPKLPVYDIVLPGDKIWLAHAESDPFKGGSLWITSYDLEKDKKINLAKEHQFLNPDTGYSKILKPEELRIVSEYNESRIELLNSLDQSDSWKAFQEKCTVLEKRLEKYYRQIKQFWDKPEGPGKHCLAPNLSFTDDQKLISDVLEHWTIVEMLYRR